MDLHPQQNTQPKKGRPPSTIDLQISYEFFPWKVSEDLNYDESNIIKPISERIDETIKARNNQSFKKSHFTVLRSSTLNGTLNGTFEFRKQDFNLPSNKVRIIENTTRTLIKNTIINKIKQKPGYVSGDMVHDQFVYQRYNKTHRKKALYNPKIKSFQIKVKKNQSDKNVRKIIRKEIEKHEPFNDNYPYLVYNFRIIKAEQTDQNIPLVLVPMQYRNPTILEMYDIENQIVVDQNNSAGGMCVFEYIKTHFIERYKYIPKVQKSKFPSYTIEQLYSKLKECYVQFAKEALQHEKFKETNEKGVVYNDWEYIKKYDEFDKRRHDFWSILQVERGILYKHLVEIYKQLHEAENWEPQTGVNSLQLMAFFKAHRVHCRIMDKQLGMFLNLNITENIRHVNRAIVVCAHGHCYPVISEKVRESIYQTVNRTKKRIEIDQSKQKKIKKHDEEKPVAYIPSHKANKYHIISTMRNINLYTDLNCLENLVYDMFRTENKLPTKIKFHNGNMTEIGLKNSVTVRTNPEFDETFQLSEDLDIKFTNQSPSALFTTVLEKYNIDMHNFESSYNSISREFVRCMQINSYVAEFVNISKLQSKLITVDINKCFSSILHEDTKWLVADSLDEVEPVIDGTLKYNQKEKYIYYVECEPHTPLLFGNGVFVHDIVQQAITDGHITHDNIKYALYCKHSRNGSFSSAIDHIYEKSPELAKFAVNSFVGKLRKECTTYQTCSLSTDMNDASSIRFSNVMKDAMLNSNIYKTITKESGESLYKVITDHQHKKNRNTLPIHAQIIQLARLKVYKLSREIQQQFHVDTAKISTDSVTFVCADDQTKKNIEDFVNKHDSLIGGLKLETNPTRCNRTKLGEPSTVKTFDYKPTTLKHIKYGFNRKTDDDEHCTKMLTWLQPHKTMLIQGIPGSGKSYFINKLTGDPNVYTKFGVDNESQIYKCAFTNVAALNIGGQTLHKQFGVDITGKCSYKTDFKKVKMIIIDEVSMLPTLFYDIISNARLVNPDIRIYAFGDCRQLPAVGEEDIDLQKLQVITDLFKHTIFWDECFRTSELQLFDLSMQLRNIVNNSMQIDHISSDMKEPAVNCDDLFEVFSSQTKESIDYDIKVNITFHNHERKILNKLFMRHHKTDDAIYLPRHKELKHKREQIGDTPVGCKWWQPMWICPGLPIIRANPAQSNGMCPKSEHVSKDILNNEVFRVRKILNENEIEIIRLRNFQVEYGEPLTIPLNDSFPYNWSPAYAVTTHKTQGQTLEIPFCIFELDKLCQFADARAIYTALTRATKFTHIHLASPKLSKSISYKNRVAI